MGVPKFYRWLSERYPCLSEVVKEHQIPEFDQLYLDMNGIIHNCSHPNDDDPHFRISEEQIFKDIFHYIEVLFRMIQPRKVFFMAIDGVAPRAKMNQQRGRRFRSAREAEQNDKKARDRGEMLPKEAKFDSNCITPGTPFMVRLHDQLQYFVSNKVSNDTLWQKVNVILSGHETPGEGEHKIMEFIRHQKAQPDYDPNLRHCLYGLDADLVMLGLCTHDPHFSLLREEVRFGAKKQGGLKRIATPEETTFHLLHLSLLREYIDYEFQDLKGAGVLPFPFCLESIIDDWVLLGFLVGNDFVPNLPNIHINKGALTELFGAYKRILPNLEGYINNNGSLNLKRFQVLLLELGTLEMKRFQDIYSDTKWLEGKSAQRTSDGRHKIKSTPGPAEVEELLAGGTQAQNVATSSASDAGWVTVPKSKKSVDSDLKRLLLSTEEFMSDDSNQGSELEDDVFSSFQLEFRHFKRDYYMQKMGFLRVDETVLKEQAEGYIRAIQWILHYYYNGCQSWSWYFPHHYTPWITDITGFSDMNLTYELDKPFLPYEQLLAVLPAASKQLLPVALQSLMINEESPIIEYFPVDFECDLNGKQQEWEAVVLIPFIDEKRLLDAISPLLPRLSKEEIKRNSHGPILSYIFSPDCLGSFNAPAYFPPVNRNHALCRQVNPKEWHLEIAHLKKGLMTGVRLDVFFPGFPTLKHVEHVAFLKQAGVRVFEQASRGENMILKLTNTHPSDSAANIAKVYIGSEIWISWPHMTEAKVTKVVTDQSIFTVEKGTLKEARCLDESLMKPISSIKERYMSRWGIDIGGTRILIYATPMTGRKYVCGTKGKITLEKQWAKSEVPYVYQTTRKDILVHDPSFTQYRTLSELFPVGSVCFMVGQPHYGAKGKVLKVSVEHRGRIQVSFGVDADPDLTGVVQAKESLSMPYVSAYEGAQQLGVRPHIISRITGSIFVNKSSREADSDRASKVNIGLNLKFNRRNEEVSGYTRRQNDTWLYSRKTIELVEKYMTAWPEIFRFLGSNSSSSNQKDVFYADQIFSTGRRETAENPSQVLARVVDLQKWLKQLPSSEGPRQACGTRTLDENVVQEIENVLDSMKNRHNFKEITMQVRPHLLYKPDLIEGNTQPDEKAKHFLFDRVVNVRDGHSVPLGLAGIITGIQEKVNGLEKEVYYDVVFEEAFSGGLALRSSSGRSYRLPPAAFINISYGKRATQNDRENGRSASQKPMAVVQPLQSRQLPCPREKDDGRGHHSLPPVTQSSSLPPDPTSLPNPESVFGASASSDGKKESENGLQHLWNKLRLGQDEDNIELKHTKREIEPETMGKKVNPPQTFIPMQVSKKLAAKPITAEIEMKKKAGKVRDISSKGVKAELSMSNRADQENNDEQAASKTIQASSRKKRHDGRKIAAKFDPK